MAAAKISRIALWGALLVTLYLTFEIARQPADDPAEAVSTPLRNTSRPTADGVSQPDAGVAASVALPRRHWREDAVNDPFRPITWFVAPRPRAAPAVRPQAPPVPFSYFGKMTEGDVPYAFLYHGNKVLVVRPGDVLANAYRVESIAPESVSLTYLPLNTRQIVPLGEMESRLVLEEAQVGEEDASDSKAGMTESAGAAPVNMPALQELLRNSAARVTEKNNHVDDEKKSAE